MKRLVVLGLVLLCACHDDLPPAPTGLSLSPTEGPDNVETIVTISGDFLVARVKVNLSSPRDTKVDGLIAAELSDARLEIQDVDKEGKMRAVVPAGMRLDWHTLILTDPEGKQATLNNAFFVRPGTCADLGLPEGGTCPDRCGAVPGCGCQGTACAPVCGDGILREGEEECDTSPFEPASDGCIDCRIVEGWSCTGEPSECEPICGDGLVRGEEACDDGNRTDEDGCTGCIVDDQWICNEAEPSACEPIPATCFNGILEDSEQCDDGNRRQDDGCENCRIMPGWDCDTRVQPTFCWEVCGDGEMVGEETCDDLNQSENDGCSKECRIEQGYCCRGQPSNCYDTCGDGQIDSFEECDNGGQAGCSPCCEVESGWACFRQPSVCVHHSDIVWVSNSTVSGALSCPGFGTKDNPYCTIQLAIDDSRSEITIVILPGTYSESIDFNDVVRTVIVKEWATLDARAERALRIRNESHVEIIGLDIHGGGVDVSGTDTWAKLRECRIGPSAEVGVTSEDTAFLVLSRNLIKGNEGGGAILASQGGYYLENNIIVENGSNTHDFGGVKITETSSGSLFVHNTVANNRAHGQSTAGVFCPSQQPNRIPIPLVNSILMRDPAVTGAADPGYRGRCLPYHCLLGRVVTSSTTVPSGNIEGDPAFDQTYHIDPQTSDAKDQGDATFIPYFDFDGEERYQGFGVDIGADEAG